MPLEPSAPSAGAAAAVSPVHAVTALPRTLVAQPLTRAAFAPFGDVIESGLDTPISINGGMTERFHDLAAVDLGPDGSRTLINIFETQPYAMPLRVAMLERHPLGSQAFIPMDGSPFLVVVAPSGDAVDVAGIQAFITNGRQGVNYGRGVWHHPLVVTERPASFLVVDRGGAGHNCDEQHFAEVDVVSVQLPGDAAMGAVVAPPR